MKENKYDDKTFFDKYSKMDRSIKGLQGAGEWHEFKKMFPNLKDKTVLDIGCGFGWHCKYAVENGATRVVGIDLSKKMIQRATTQNNDSKIEYIQCAIEDYTYPENTFDIVISSLTLHYIESFDLVCKKVFYTLKKEGDFIFSVEHPIFTANGKEEWEYQADGSIKHWPVDHYFDERIIRSNFLGEEVIKYHKTITHFVNTLIQNGFVIKKLVEPQPERKMLEVNQSMRDELRRPMMLLISAQK